MPPPPGLLPHGVHRVYGTLKAFPQEVPEYVIAYGRFVFTGPDNSNPAGVEKILEIFYRHDSSFMIHLRINIITYNDMHRAYIVPYKAQKG